MPKVDLSQIEQSNRTGYPAPYNEAVAGRWYRRLAPPTGLADFGVSEVTLQPGAWSSQRHWHDGEDESARAMARSMAAEMHSGFANLRRELPFNVRSNFGSVDLSPAVEAEVVRILNLWAQARARFGGTGEYLFGDWSAADIMYAPIVTRFVTYGVKVPPFAATYMDAVLHRADVVEWIELAQEEPWVIEEYEAGSKA
jgi:glutathione S-transferase